MLASVTRLGVMVRVRSGLVDVTGEERVNPDLLGRVLCGKSPREAKEGETKGSLDLPG